MKQSAKNLFTIIRSPQIKLLTQIWRPVLGTIVVIFLSAGRADYWQGWLFICVNLIFYLLNVMVLRNTPGLAQERLSPGEGVKVWDKNILRLFRVLYYLIVFTAGLDAGRFRATPDFPVLLYQLSFVIYIVGQLIHIWAKSTNIFFSTVVRIQKDRGQTVCTRGPYRISRHPGYLGTIVYMAVTPLMLGSLWAIIPTILYIAIAIIRTNYEDIILHGELLGYAEYAKKVRYKLVPGVW